MSGGECVHSPCSKGWPLTAVAFILRASLADVSQCEPLLVSWSLSAWSLSPWPLSRRLARSASLNVELQQSRRKKKKKHNLPLPLCKCSYLIAVVSWLDKKMKKLNALVRKPLDRPLTFEQMVACCQHNWTLRGNFLSRHKRKIIFCIDHVQNFMQFFNNSLSYMRFRQEQKCFCQVFSFLYFLLWHLQDVSKSHRAPASDDGMIRAHLHCDHMCLLGKARE